MSHQATTIGGSITIGGSQHSETKITVVETTNLPNVENVSDRSANHFRKHGVNTKLLTVENLICWNKKLKPFESY